MKKTGARMVYGTPACARWPSTSPFESIWGTPVMRLAPAIEL